MLVTKRTSTIFVIRLIFAGNFVRLWCNTIYFMFIVSSATAFHLWNPKEKRRPLVWLPFLSWCSKIFDIYDLTMFVLSNLVVNFVTILPTKLQNIPYIDNFPGVFQWQNKGQLTAMRNHDYRSISNCVSYQIYSGHRTSSHQLL